MRSASPKNHTSPAFEKDFMFVKVALFWNSQKRSGTGSICLRDGEADNSSDWPTILSTRSSKAGRCQFARNYFMVTNGENIFSIPFKTNVSVSLEIAKMDELVRIANANDCCRFQLDQPHDATQYFLVNWILYYLGGGYIPKHNVAYLVEIWMIFSKLHELRKLHRIFSLSRPTAIF